MSRIKENRNKDLVEKRLSGWSYGKLADHFNLSRPRVLEIWLENKDKFTDVRAVHNSGVDKVVRGDNINL